MYLYPNVKKQPYEQTAFNLYRKFDTCIILEEQMRQTIQDSDFEERGLQSDEDKNVWKAKQQRFMKVLDNLHEGIVNQEDYDFLSERFRHNVVDKDKEYKLKHAQRFCA